MKKFFAVLLSVCVMLCSAVTFACAYTAKDDAPDHTQSQNTNMSNSAIGSILRGFLGDAANNLTNNELGQIFGKLFGDFDISSLFGAGSESFIGEILEYINSLETTTDTEAATKPPVTTQEPTTEEPTTEPPTEEPATAEPAPQETAKPVEHYYYYYIQATTLPDMVMPGGESTTFSYEYIPPETIYTDLLTPSAPGTVIAGDDEGGDGVGVKTVIGVLILLGSGAAVVILCVRKKNSYI